jgi:hypothetical protein
MNICKLLKRRKNITTYPVGQRVPPNKKVEQIVERAKKKLGHKKSKSRND